MENGGVGMERKWIKWIKTAHKGLRYYEHPTRRHGKKRDRYYAIRFKVANQDYSYGVGWWSNGIPEEVKKDDPRLGFEEYALKLLRQYQGNMRAGSGPKSPKENRKNSAEKEQEERNKRDQIEKGNITFKKYFEDTYSPIAKTSKKVSSFDHEETHFRLWIEPVVGDLPLRIISKNHVELIKKKVMDAKKAPRTVQYILATFRQVWNMARGGGLVTGDSPTKIVKISKFDNRRQRFFNHDEADVLLRKLKETSKQIYQMAFLALHTGMRASEIFRLTWGCIDTDRGIITILDAKPGKGRPAFMTEQVRAMFLDMTEGKNDDLVFPNKDGGTFSEISHIFRDAVVDLKFNEGVKDRRQRVMFHTLRHTFGSWHAEAGTDLYVIKELMGHGSITLTERYSHLSQGTLQNATRNLERSIDIAEQEKTEQVAT
jgi:integrase